MRTDCGTKRETRESALWGKRGSGSRFSALWGKGGRGSAAVLALVFALSAPVAASAAGPFVPKNIRSAIAQKPDARYDVIVQGRAGKRAADMANAVAQARRQAPGKALGVERSLRSVNGVAAEVTGKQLAKLMQRGDVYAITRDAKMQLAAYSNVAKWPQVAGVNGFWNPTGSGVATSSQAPAIAIVDSGIQANRADFSGQVRAQVNMTGLLPNSAGDGRGHGTFVASLAAGGADNRAGAAAGAPIVSIDVMDDAGMAMTSDVIAATDWILTNKDRYNIRVANFSLHSTVPSSFMFDPLNKAVEKLWFGGVVVVAAAGNYGEGNVASGVHYAPANDPFVITVGASDINDSTTPADDVAAPWSAYGYTDDGFRKPELSAPGRYMVGAVPALSTMALSHPERKVGLNYMWMSGTSFAAPLVAGAAANLLARHPDWTPDQVKGALMLTARQTADANGALGVGEIHAASASNVVSPPNPNAALNSFLVADASGSSVPVFDVASWASVAQSDASWAAASWASASWASASWAAQATEDASWAAASWAAASWSAASWAAASWVY